MSMLSGRGFAAPFRLVPVTRTRSVSTGSGSALRGARAIMRLGLSALVAVTLVAGAAVAQGRTEIPLQALAAARVATGFPSTPAVARFRTVVAPPRLPAGTSMTPAVAEVGAEAREQVTVMVQDFESQQEI